MIPMYFECYIFSDATDVRFHISSTTIVDINLSKCLLFSSLTFFIVSRSIMAVCSRCFNFAQAVFILSGLYKCTGYNKLPNSSVDDEMEKTVEIIVVKNVEASLTSTSDTDEVFFGAALNLTCNVKGGRAPFYIRVQFTDQDGGVSNLIEYNGSNMPDNIKEEKNSLEYVHVINGVGYNDGGVYDCSGKNRAYENAEKIDGMTKEVVVGKNVILVEHDTK